MKISYIAQSIKDLKVISLILAMQARQDIDLGEAYLQGDKWRGGFGQSLKMLSCLN